MDELWKDIDNFKGYYQISNKGRVRSLDRYVIANNHGGKKLLKGKIMKLTRVKGRQQGKNNYLAVNLRKEGKNKVYLIHQLVGQHFIPNPNNLPTINHIDGIKYHNNVENLEWLTYSKNNQHAYDNLLKNPRGVCIGKYSLDGELLTTYKSVTDAERIDGFKRGSISHCINNRQNTYSGYIWKKLNKQQ